MAHEKITEAVRRLGVRFPIIQGPFGGGLSTARLAAAVSNLGGLGSYGAHSLAPSDLGPLVNEIRSLTPHPFAVNLWVSDHDQGGLELNEAEFDRVFKIFEPYYREFGIQRPEHPPHFHHSFEEQFEALIEANPPVFSFVFGVPRPEILAECRRRGIVTIGTATSIAEARMLDEAGVDLIVATGFEAGGHRTSFLKPAEDSLMGTFVLTQLVSDRVKTPVIAAGGIADARGLRAALSLGAQMVQIGTAFLACEESGTTPEHRAMLFSDKAEQTTLTRSFTGRLARGISNRWTEEMIAHSKELPPFPIQSWFMSYLKSVMIKTGRTDVLPLYGGQIAPNLRHRTAPALMESILERL
ncbi:NAD(P)H-dependent flavin oxidoreductase [Leptospira adleri]|uniref:NAD(P)H-dependent flavin oxidoreductase n=1 Tax=Leptospira adleri TaxID=2023186 RepID=UPI001082B62A|nr:nitronate monooxygenase [Leptospira adleri]TGM58863.1 nitronate monooxygenase [Leptospira adleri]